MKRREAKFVHASPRLSPDQINAAPRLREDRVDDRASRPQHVKRRRQRLESAWSCN
jgi:hypothetical protein